MTSDRKKRLYDLTSKGENAYCADCSKPHPDWASYNIGVFLCEQCAGLHRSLGSHISKIKSLKLDNWEDDQVKFMEVSGNRVARQKYEAQVPMCYRQPLHTDPVVLKEQWVRAKYERLEFTDIDKQTYLSGRLEGYLWKRGKKDSKFNRRRFVLNETENTLKYYNKEDPKADPKEVIRMDDISVTLVTEKVGNPNAMQISFTQNGQFRSIYVFAEDSQDLVSWYTAIRSARLNRLRIAYPGTHDEELIPMLTQDFTKEGWLMKTGPNRGDAYRRRWFTLDKRTLKYYEDPMDAFPKGEIFIGYTEEGYKLRDGVPVEIKDPGHTFTLRTPSRGFHFAAESMEEKMDWLDVIRRVVSTPLTPQDISNRARVKHK